MASETNVATDLSAAVDPILSTVASGSTYGTSLVWGDRTDVAMGVDAKGVTVSSGTLRESKVSSSMASVNDVLSEAMLP